MKKLVGIVVFLFAMSIMTPVFAGIIADDTTSIIELGIQQDFLVI